jgi:hypothetical protein
MVVRAHVRQFLHLWSAQEDVGKKSVLMSSICMQAYFIHGHRDEYINYYFVALKFKVGNNLVVLWLCYGCLPLGL